MFRKDSIESNNKVDQINTVFNTKIFIHNNLTISNSLLAVQPVPVVPRPASHRAHNTLQPLEYLTLGRPTPHIQAPLPLARPGPPHTQLLVLLTVVAIVYSTPAHDTWPGQALQVHHVKKFTEVWPAVQLDQGGIYYRPLSSNLT